LADFHTDLKTIGSASCPFYAAFRIVVQAFNNSNVNNTGCADDIALLSTQLSDAQIMVNIALDFANLEGYELQPKKSVVQTV
jgi:uncharacterized protein YueI